jgi:hypothetical protein
LEREKKRRSKLIFGYELVRALARGGAQKPIKLFENVTSCGAAREWGKRARLVAYSPPSRFGPRATMRKA